MPHVMHRPRSRKNQRKNWAVSVVLRLRGRCSGGTDMHVLTWRARAGRRKGRAEQLFAGIASRASRYVSLVATARDGLSGRICSALRKRGMNMTRHLFELPGNTVLDLMQHLERCFHKHTDVSCANTHQWHLDHKVTIAKYK